MHLPGIQFSRALSPRSLFIFAPTFGVMLAAVLFLPLFFLLPQPDLIVSAQEPDPTTEPTPWCGDGVCNEDYGEAYYNCQDCLNSCSWCTDQAFCESIMPEAEWFFVPGFSGCSTEGCCVHILRPTDLHADRLR